MNIKKLKINQKARISNYNGISADIRHKLTSMGLHKRATFRVVRKAPLGGPWQFIVGNTAFSARINDIEQIEIELINEQQPSTKNDSHCR